MRTTVVLLAFLMSGAIVFAEDAPRVLFLSKSSTFIHSTIKRDGDKPSHLDKLLPRLGKENGFEIVSTKDAGQISAENLAKFDIVMFYTTGDLTVSGKKGGVFGGDGSPGMGEKGLDELLAWIRAGGKFIGYHNASDTFHGPRNGPVSTYIEMLGGEFLTHGPIQFEGTVRVTDMRHPAMKSFPEEWLIRDEWYILKNYNRDAIHVLALFDAGEARSKYKMYGPAYPIAWCRSYGKGRVYYNAMGHREDVWDNPIFQKTVIDALNWLLDDGPTQAEPNFNGGALTTK